MRSSVLLAITVLLLLVPIGLISEPVGLKTSDGAPLQSFSPALGNGSGSGLAFTLIANVAVGKLSVQHSVYDTSQQANFTLYLYSGASPDTHGANVSVSGAGLTTQWHNYTTSSSSGLYRYWNVTPTSQGTLWWNMTVHDWSNTPGQPVSGSGSPLHIQLHPSSGALSLSASETRMYISEPLTLTLSSSISGGTQPYKASWYQNNATVLVGTGLNATFSPQFRSPGKYEFRVASYDSAGWGPIVSNNVTVRVYGLPSEDFIHSRIPMSNRSYEMEFSINSPVKFYQNVTFPDGSKYSGNGNVTVNYTFTTAGIKTIGSQISWNGSIIENLSFNLSVQLNVQILASATEGLSPLTVHFNASIQGSSNYSYLWVLRPGITSNLTDPSEIYPYGLYNVTLEVYGNNGTHGSAYLPIRSNLSAYMVLHPQISEYAETVYLNVSVISNYTISSVNVTVKGLGGTTLLDLKQVSVSGTDYSFATTMDEFKLLQGSYTANFSALSSRGIINHSLSSFQVNFSFAWVYISFSQHISSGLLELDVNTESNYTVDWVDLQLSGPSGVTSYNMTLTSLNVTTDTYAWTVQIDVYSLGSGNYSALISSENSRNFTNFSAFGFTVQPSVQPSVFTFSALVNDFGGLTNFVVSISAIAGIIGVLGALASRGTETVYIGGQAYKSRPGKPLTRETKKKR